MARKNMSYFAEERSRNNNPNFFKNMSSSDLRRQVKRIIKDIRNGSIELQDLVYFTQDNIISACITESYAQWKSAETIQNALMYYNSSYLCHASQNQIVGSNNVWIERTNVANELGKFANKANVWNRAYIAFYNIKENIMPIQEALGIIYSLDKSLFYDL